MQQSIRQYRLSSLIVIVFYKAIYRICLVLKKIRLFLFSSDWSSVIADKCVAFDNQFESFYSCCDTDISNVLYDADNILGGQINVFGKSVSFNPFEDWLIDPITRGTWNNKVFFSDARTYQAGLADVKYVLEINKFNHLVRVALAYYHTKNEKYLKYISNSIIGYRNNVKPYRGIVQRIIMDMGFRVVNLVQVMILCSSNADFNKTTCPLINGIILDQIKAIEQFHTAKWFKTGNGANHVIGEMVGLIIGQLWLQMVGIKDYSGKYSREYDYLVTVLDRTIAPSGAYLEQSGNYSRLVAEFLTIFDILKDCMGHEGYYIDYEKGQYTTRIQQYLRDISYNDYVPNFGDNDDAYILTAFRNSGGLVEYFIKEKDYSYDDRKYLDGSQWVFNSGDSCDFHLFTRVGKYAFFREGASIHAHNDLLALLLGIKGQPVFIDRGMLFYNSGNAIRIDYSKISAHNTIALDGIEMTRLGAGYCFDYPESNYIPMKDSGPIIFSGALKYNGIEQKRTISYCDGKIHIEDIVSVGYENEIKGVINFLLDPNIGVEVQDSNVFLVLNNGERVSVSFKGVDFFEVKKVCYSQSYGQLRDTNIIVGHLKVNKKNVIHTDICLNV